MTRPVPCDAEQESLQRQLPQAAAAAVEKAGSKLEVQLEVLQPMGEEVAVVGVEEEQNRRIVEAQPMMNQTQQKHLHTKLEEQHSSMLVGDLEMQQQQQMMVVVRTWLD